MQRPTCRVPRESDHSRSFECVPSPLRSRLEVFRTWHRFLRLHYCCSVVQTFRRQRTGTEVPLIGTVNVSVFENAPVVPLRKTTAPPVAAEVLERRIVTVGVIAPDGFVTRIRHDEGAHDTNRALGIYAVIDL